MAGEKSLEARFEAEGPRLRTLAYRMLGSAGEAEDAVQEAWLRLSRSDAGVVENLGGWLTTVVARVCLDMLRARKSRREEPLDAHAPERIASNEPGIDPEQEAVMADSIGLALLVVLQTLAPAERVAFVLHDMFDLPFDEIAPIVGRSATATRQLASRARRRVRGSAPPPDADLSAERKVVEAFLAASRSGDLAALLAVLDPDVVFRSDAALVQRGEAPELRGAPAVAEAFRGRAQAAQMAFMDDGLGLAVVLRGTLFVALKLELAHGRIVAVEAIGDPERLGRLDYTLLEN